MHVGDELLANVYAALDVSSPGHVQNIGQPCIRRAGTHKFIVI